MFDSSNEFRYVQRKKNKLRDQFQIEEHIYVFFINTEFNLIKYVACVSVYPEGLLKIDFYPKIRSDNKYKLQTNQRKFGTIGGTIFNIMQHVIDHTGFNTFGILCAQTLEEEKLELIENTKRFRVYKEILSRKLNPEIYSVFENIEFSTLFVIPNNRLKEKNELILSYAKIFEQNY